MEFNDKKHTRNIILKSRKLGFTTDEALDSLDDVLFQENTEANMLSYDSVSQLDIFNSKIVFAWENLEEDLRDLYTLDADRANKLTFNWGDKTATSISVRTKGRSGTLNRLHISEFAKICKENPLLADEIISGTIQAVPLTGRVDIESTAEEDHGHFHDMFWEAWNRQLANPEFQPNLAEYKSFFFNWTYDDMEMEKIVPMALEKLPAEFIEYKQKFNLTDLQITYYYFKWLSVNKDWALLHREYPTTPEEAFLSAGNKFFDPMALEKLQAQPVVERIGEWRYYDEYRRGHRYAIGSDSSEGRGNDNAAIVAIDFDAKPRAKVVAVFASDRTAPDTLAYDLKNCGTRLGHCLIAPERNYPGNVTVMKLRDMYANIYKQETTGRQEDEPTDILGWHTNTSTKPKMLYDLASAIQNDLIEICDPDILRELRAYPKENISTVRKDPLTKHYDRVIALAIAWQMRLHAIPGYVLQEDEGAFDPFKAVGEI